jgi:signal transduction histidine kinase
VLYNRRGRLIGAATAAAPLGVLQPPLDEMRTWLLIAFPIVLALITAGGWLLIGRALAPIDRITRTAGAISAGNLSGRLGPSRSDDEVGRLAATLDQMLDRLEGAFGQQRAFAAAASHELRTPLTIVKSDLDVLRRSRPFPPDEEDVLRGVDEELARMGRMVEDLLTLARADSGQDELLCELVAFDVLVRTALVGMEHLAQEKGLTLEAHVTPGVDVVGDPSRLRQMVLNLLANAVTYTPAGGSIRVSLAREGEQAQLIVADTGIGISVEDRSHIFEHFFRADKARSRAAGGAGLGLALVHWCVRAHGGHIEVESVPGEGSTFTVSLPLALMDDDPIMTAEGQSSRTDGPNRVPAR